MAKFCGIVGFVERKEISPSVYDDVVTERTYRGDLIRQSSRWSPTEKKNDDVEFSNKVSIVMDPWANEHFNQIRFVVWNNAAIRVSSIEVEYPRLTLELGGVWNGNREEQETGT